MYKFVTCDSRSKVTEWLNEHKVTIVGITESSFSGFTIFYKDVEE